MKKKTRKTKSKDVLVTVTKEDYDRDIRAGVRPEETLSPGTYSARRGGFLERHRDAITAKVETKAGIYIKLDRDILQFFKERAKDADAAPYQTQINNALRAYLEGRNTRRDFSSLLDNETFINAVAERVRVSEAGDRKLKTRK